jgi:uncharacterized protein YjbI with pentapeptide repeats
MLGRLWSNVVGERSARPGATGTRATELAGPAPPLAPPPAAAIAPVSPAAPAPAAPEAAIDGASVDELQFRRRQIELLKLQMRFAGMQLVETLLAQPALADPRRLERCGGKTFSQNDEDGIIAEIFRRIGAPHRTFVEFGCGDGLENNTSCLLAQGWRGLWMDGGDQNAAGIVKAYGHLIAHDLLQFRQVYIDRDNIDGLVAAAGLGAEIDLLSIDLDGNDYYVWDAIVAVSARVVVVEYNGKFIPPNDWCMAYDPNHNWNGTDLMGCSLAALARLGEAKGYQLVGCNITGANAFFVRADLAGDKFAQPATASHLFQPARYDLTRCFMVGHPPNSLTILQGAYAAARLAWPPAATLDSIAHVLPL